MIKTTAPASRARQLCLRSVWLCLVMGANNAAAVTEHEVRKAVTAYYADAGSAAPFDVASLKVSPLPRFVEQTSCAQLMIVPRGRVPALSLAPFLRATETVARVHQRPGDDQQQNHDGLSQLAQGRRVAGGGPVSSESGSRYRSACVDAQ